MSYSPDDLAQLRRPRLLIRAARLGACEYRRNRDLARLLHAARSGGGGLPVPTAAVPRLLAEEAQLEEIRQRGAASYSITRHIEILIALIGEARLLPVPPKAVG